MLAARPLVACLLIFFLAATLRFSSLESGLPQTRDPDSVVVTQARGFESEREEGKGHISPLYPFFLARVIDAWPGPLISVASPEAGLEEHLSKARWPDLLARRLVAFFSLLALPAVWFLARKWSSPFGATLAMAFLGTALVHVFYTRMARPHGPVAAFGVLSVLTLAWSLQRPSWARILLACSLVGICIGTLHSGAAVLSACLLASTWLLRREGIRILPKLLVGISLTALFVASCYPFLGTESGLFASRAFVNPLNGQGLGRILPRMLRADPVLVIGAGLGAILVMARLRLPVQPGQCPGGGRDTAWLCAAHAVPYLIAICLYRHTWLRFVLVALPYMALLAAVPLERLYSAGHRRLAGAFSLLALVLPIFASSRYVMIQGRRDTSSMAAEALLDRVGKNDRVVYSALLSIPVPQVKKTIGKLARTLRSPWHEYQRIASIRTATHPLRMYPLVSKNDYGLQLPRNEIEAILRRHKPRFAVIHTNHQASPRLDPTPEIVRRACGRQVDIWLPYGGKVCDPITLADHENFLLRYAFKVQSPGRPIGLFEFPRWPAGPASK